MVSISLHNSFAWVDIIVFFVGDVAPRQWPRCSRRTRFEND